MIKTAVNIILENSFGQNQNFYVLVLCWYISLFCPFFRKKMIVKEDQKIKMINIQFHYFLDNKKKQNNKNKLVRHWMGSSF